MRTRWSAVVGLAVVTAAYLGSYVVVRAAHLLVHEAWWGGGLPPVRMHRISAGHTYGSGIALIAYAPLALLEEGARNAWSHSTTGMARDLRSS